MLCDQPGRGSERVVRVLGGERDPAGVAERLDSPAPAEAPVAGRLHTAEGRLRLVRHRLIVDVHDAGTHPACDGETVGGVLGDDSASQAVLGRVDQGDGLIVVGEGRQRAHRAERL